MQELPDREPDLVMWYENDEENDKALVYIALSRELHVGEMMTLASHLARSVCSRSSMGFEAALDKLNDYIIKDRTLFRGEADIGGECA